MKKSTSAQSETGSVAHHDQVLMDLLLLQAVTRTDTLASVGSGGLQPPPLSRKVRTLFPPAARA